ncbi:hypothetical protein BVC80_8549g4 [Macleaya cordata]|uniref:Uncharacterized protein n=1 Tax=Macleaya cordata TaxID=56857 RepID=A0A200QQ14_MACCD|nr:hypothetical protein BVC80_8549g4 [Macleaya cordata]
MDWRCNSRLDVSPFLLLETTGDSEEGVDPVIVGNKSVVVDNDDAESCNYETCDVIFVDDYNVDYDQDYYEDQDNSDYAEGCDENRYPWKTGLSELSSGSVCLGRDDDEESRVGIKGRDQEMNEIEKNKIFWETCLEVGCL